MIELHLKDKMINESYEFYYRDFFSINRFDLGFKLGVIEKLNTEDLKGSFELYAYEKHIFAITEGNFSELSSDKYGIDDYITSFKSTFNNITNNGFIKENGYIPIDQGGNILNGAHRVSSIIYNKSHAHVMKTSIKESLCYDYKYFENYGLSEELLDFSAFNILKHCDDIYIACVWPVSKEKNAEIHHILSPFLMYKKTVNFSEVGKKNLMLHLYPREDWLGSVENNFLGMDNKIIPCFENDDAVDFYFIKKENLSEVLEIKDRVRSVVNKGKHALHITDNSYESRLLGYSILNEDSLNLINSVKLWNNTLIFTSFFPPAISNKPNHIIDTLNLITDRRVDKSKLNNISCMKILGSDFYSFKYLIKNGFLTNDEIKEISKTKKNNKIKVKIKINILIVKLKAYLRKSQIYPFVIYLKRKCFGTI